MIGRNRSLAASIAARPAGIPCFISRLANSTIKMAFLADKPISVTKPIWK